MRSKRILCFILFILMNVSATARDSVMNVTIRGNAKVESEAIQTILKTQKGEPLSDEMIAEDIRSLFELGYFSDIRFFSEKVPGGVNVIVEVVEKPAISSIAFEGLDELSEDDFKEKLETKIYTIVNESTINNDLRMVEKQYTDKGYYLAKANYRLDKKGANEVDLTFMITEGGLVQVGSVYILGNKYYTDADIINNLYSRPITRASTFSTPGSLFQDDFLKRDLEFISYYYRDQGFAEVKVAKPITLLDSDREYVRLTFEIEEGLQYYVAKQEISGDVLFPKEELLEAMQLKPDELFRYSRFQRDVDMLINKYGDLGYAFVDVNPKVSFNRDSKPPTVDIDYEITKGDKVYFGDITIVGNSKTRDNVVRRDLETASGGLYSGTGLTKSKNNVERLGFFEEVQAIKNRDEKDPTQLNYRWKVKEKPTGQLQAALGFQPGQAATENKWFGQGRYNEENQSGYGWQTSLTGKWNGENNYSVETGFSNPRVNDSYWSLGLTAFVRNRVREITDEITVEEREIGGSVKVGRRIIELLRGSVTYQMSRLETTTQTFVIEKLRRDGIKSTAIFSLSRNSTNNFLDPSEGSDVSLNQSFTGGPYLGGDFQYMESSADAAYFFPIDFSETYRTYFRFHANIAHIYPMSKQPVPLLERYRLGGFNDMRGYDFNEIGPHYNILQNPNGNLSSFNKGGDKQLYFQLEYFAPLIQEAGIKALIFADAGNVYDDDENISLNGLYKDFGFGFRWITPIAPFRFEWAYPLEEGRAGDMKFIFYLGY